MSLRRCLADDVCGRGDTLAVIVAPVDDDGSGGGGGGGIGERYAR